MEAFESLSSNNKINMWDELCNKINMGEVWHFQND